MIIAVNEEELGDPHLKRWHTALLGERETLRECCSHMVVVFRKDLISFVSVTFPSRCIAPKFRDDSRSSLVCEGGFSAEKAPPAQQNGISTRRCYCHFFFSGLR